MRSRKGKGVSPEATTINPSISVDASAVVQSKHPAVIETEGRETLPLPVTGLILCGGRSKRMGRPKAFLPFAGRTIIEHLIDTTREIFSEVFLVANEPDQYSHLTVDVVKDILPYRGPLGGILSGLLVSANPFAFVIACDMPLVTRKLLRQMATHRHDADVVVLSHAGSIEPLLGVYSKNCIKPLEESLFSGVLKVQDFLSGLKAKLYEYTPERPEGDDLPPFFNINTPQDYSAVLLRVKSSPHRSGHARRLIYPAP
ncbi:MAG TPA: molybdenum cofactor guanylyltransferase [Candidatus Obscuribacterales bacterium]